MYLLTKKINRFSAKREELFLNLLKSDYSEEWICEYKKFLKVEAKKNSFKNVNLGLELRSLLAALSLSGVKKGLNIICLMEGYGCYSCNLTQIEYTICERTVELALNKDKLYVIAVINDDFLNIWADNRLILSERLIPVNRGGYISCKEMLIDRLSPVNLALTGE